MKYLHHWFLVGLFIVTTSLLSVEESSEIDELVSQEEVVDEESQSHWLRNTVFSGVVIAGAIFFEKRRRSSLRVDEAGAPRIQGVVGGDDQLDVEDTQEDMMARAQARMQQVQAEHRAQADRLLAADILPGYFQPVDFRLNDETNPTVLEVLYQRADGQASWVDFYNFNPESLQFLQSIPDGLKREASQRMLELHLRAAPVMAYQSLQGQLAGRDIWCSGYSVRPVEPRAAAGVPRPIAVDAGYTCPICRDEQLGHDIVELLHPLEADQRPHVVCDGCLLNPGLRNSFHASCPECRRPL